MSSLSFYVVWVTLVCVHYGLYAYFSALWNSSDGDKHWAVGLFVWGALAQVYWIVVSRFSKSLVFDALLYDTCVTVTWVCVLAVLEATSKGVEFRQAVGIFLAIGGLLLVHSER